jgi:hypothetical protein
MLHRVALVRTDVSEEPSASFIRVTGISETSVLTRATWRIIPEDTILHIIRNPIPSSTIWYTTLHAIYHTVDKQVNFLCSGSFTAIPMLFQSVHRIWSTNKNKTDSVALSPQANYTDWATATFWWNLVSTSVDRGVSRGQRGRSPTIINLSFLDRSRYFSFK